MTRGEDTTISFLNGVTGAGSIVLHDTAEHFTSFVNMMKTGVSYEDMDPKLNFFLFSLPFFCPELIRFDPDKKVFVKFSHYKIGVEHGHL
jgi:hypothetical protein